MRGRRYVLPQDVAELAPDVLRHRIVLTYEALAEGVQPDAIVERVLGAVQQPRLELTRERASHDRAALPTRERTPDRPGPGPMPGRRRAGARPDARAGASTA